MLDQLIEQAREEIHDCYDLGSDGNVYVHSEKLDALITKAFKAGRRSRLERMDRKEFYKRVAIQTIVFYAGLYFTAWLIKVTIGL